MINQFDSPGPSHDDLAKTTAIWVEALVHLLIEKGIITDQEFISAKCRVTAEFDQQTAARMEELKAANPGLAPFFKMFESQT